MKLGNLNYRLSRQEHEYLSGADHLFMISKSPKSYDITIHSRADGKTYVVRRFNTFSKARLFGTFCHRYTGLLLYLG